MTQADFTIANQTFPNTRTELNTSLQALATNSAGNSAPSTTFPSQWWFDSDGNQLYIRNKDNDAWVKVFTIGATSDKIENLGIDSLTLGGATPTLTIGDGGAEDAKIIFDGNAQNFSMGLDDSTDLLTIGLGNTLGQYPAITIDENTNVVIPDSSLTVIGTGNYDIITLKSTDADSNVGPVLNFTRDSSSPANNDFLGELTFQGDNNAGETHDYIRMFARILNVADGSEQADFIIKDATGTNIVNMAHTEVVYNDDSVDRDFRVESNGNTHMLFVDGGNNAVGIGNNGTLDGTLHIRSVASGDTHVVLEAGATDGNTAFLFHNSAGTQKGFISYDTDDNFLTLGTNATERMRIESDGGVVIGDTSTSRMLGVKTPSGFGQFIVDFNNASTSAPYGILNRYSGAAPDSGSDFSFLECADTGANRFNIFSDGDVKNHDNSYGALSDERIKQDIRDSNSQWNDIKAVKVRNFKRKDDVRQYGDNAWEQIGVVAQELEAVSPKLIRKHNPTSHDILSSSEFGTLYTADDSETQDAVLYTSNDQEVINGDKNVGDIKTPSTKQIGEVKTIAEQVKSVSYSVLYMKAIKALQEAMTKIEDLEARVTTLEG